jgi:hypothetical protein
MDNQIELNKFYLIYKGGPIIVYAYDYYGKYGNRIRFNKWHLCPFVWDLVGIEEHNYVDINSESSIRDFIWVCPDRNKEFTLTTRQLNRYIFDSIMVYESRSAVDFVKYIRDNFNHNTVGDLHIHNFQDNFDCDARQEKN